VYTESADSNIYDDAMIRTADGRTAIDSLDSQLIKIIKSRQATSWRIQRERMAAGGPRVVLSREMDIIDRFTAALGPAGAVIATDILALCRYEEPGQAKTADLDD
jgi:chorismate mutase